MNNNEAIYPSFFRDILIFFGLMLPALTAACTGAPRTGPGAIPLLGNWRYEECTIKNTSVQGTLRFYGDGRMVLNARARDDCPVPEISGTYRYRIQENTLITNYENGYGLGLFFLVKGDLLYFSSLEIQEPLEEWRDGRLSANWILRLRRIR